MDDPVINDPETGLPGFEFMIGPGEESALVTALFDGFDAPGGDPEIGTDVGGDPEDDDQPDEPDEDDDDPEDDDDDPEDGEPAEVGEPAEAEPADPVAEGEGGKPDPEVA